MWSNRISSLLLFATVTLAPLPFGSTSGAAIAVWCVVLGAGLMLTSLHELRGAHFKLLFGCAVIVLAYAFVLHEQLSAHPFIASPDRIWQQASAALETQLTPVASIARNQPYFAVGAPLSAMLALVCSLIVCADRIRARQLIKVIAWSGAAYAVFGIVAFFVDPTKTLWRRSAYPDVLTATFVNRNTAAAYFGSCSIAWLLMTCEPVRGYIRGHGNRWRFEPRKIVGQLGNEITWPFAMLVLCLIAMFMTASRGGVIVSLIALVSAFAGIFHRSLTRVKAWLLVMTIIGSVALLLLQIVGTGVSGRLESQGLADEGRLATYRSTLHMIGDHPWFGTGLGTFAWSFPSYRTTDASMSGTWDRAHDTPLELASDVGLPLAGLVACGWVLALAILIHGMRVRDRDLVVPTAAFSISILANLHSLVDFSLQTSGYAIGVFAVLGAGLSQSFRSEPKRNKEKVA